MKTVITGTSRGIGLELVKQALDRGDEVLALARKPEKSGELMRLRERFAQHLQITDADVSDAEAAHKVQAALKSWAHVDVLINNAGILPQGTSRQDFLNAFTVNSIAPFEVTLAALPWLKKSSKPRVVHITSLMGSIEDNGSGGYYAYRSSKAALNMINKSISCDHKWLTSIVVHPGWVQTDMGGTGAPISIVESARGIWNVALEADNSKSGKFFDFRGKSLPW